MEKKKLLINHIYYSPVGHAVEALKFAKGFAEANPDIEVHVALSKYTPTELTQACPWIAETYAIDVFEFLEEKEKYDSLKHVPKSWDYIMTNDLILYDTKGSSDLGKEKQGMVSYLSVSKNYFTATIGEGTIAGATRPTLPPGLEYKFNSKIKLELPEHAVAFAKQYAHSGPTIAMLLGGSAGYSYYPAVESWMKILEALNAAFPDVKVYMTGVRKSIEGRTHTEGYSDEQIQTVLDSFDNVVDCYDIGLWNQLALIQQSNVFISPHTGFAFLAPCVNTPWLAISGGDWPEYFFNHIPFYSVLPDNPEYPYKGKLGIDKYAQEGRIKCMEPERLEKKIPEIVTAAKLLMSEDFTYEDALNQHLKNIEKANVRREEIPKGPGF